VQEYINDCLCCWKSSKLCLPPLLWGDIFCPSVTQFVSATPLKLLNRISWNLVDSKDTICSCAYYQEILIAWILWSYAPLNLEISRNLLLKQLVSATPLKLLNRISWNVVGSKDTICSCAYYQEMLISWILWELCPFELRNFPKLTTEAACQRNSSETTEQNFMKLGR
jgi:hypothetical protein